MSKQSEQSGLTFEESTHTYKYGDTVLTSVTQWLDSFEEPFDVKETSKRYAKWLRSNGYTHVNGKKVTAELVQDEWGRVRDNGTEVHRQIEGLIKGEKIYPYPNKGAKDAYEFVNDYTVVSDTIEPEMRVHSLRHGLAGSIDCPVFHKDGSVSIIDWKIIVKLTPVKLKKYTLQLSTYAYILETEARQTIKDLKLVQVTDEGITVHNIEYKKDKVIELLKESNRW